MAAVLFAFPALAADQLILTNGDIITAAIIKKDGARITVKNDFLGEVSLPWTAVKSIHSDTELNVVLPSGETVKGTIATAGDQLQVISGNQTRTAPLAGIATLRDEAEQHAYERLERPGVLELWRGNIDLGLALARGNARSDTLTSAFTAVRDTRNDKVAVYFNQIRGTARINNVTSAIASAIRGGWKYNRNFDGRLFVTGFNDYEHDRFQNLDLRFVAGAGLGVRAAKTERLQLDFDAGGDYQRENFLEGLHRNSGEVNFGDALLYKLSRAVSVTQAARTFVNATQSGEYRMNMDLTATTALRRWLGWNITASDRFLSNPVQGRQRNDLLLSTGFRVTFFR